MKAIKLVAYCSVLATLLSSDSCDKTTFKPMDINSQGRLDLNFFQLNPQWQHRITNNTAPDPAAICPCQSDNPDDWTNSPTCTSQSIHMNTGKSCPNLGGHVNWFTVTYEGSLYWSDKSSPISDDDYNLDMRRNDGALYTGAIEHIRLEFDSDETVDHWDNTGTFWERFHGELDNDDRNGEILINGQYAIAIGLVGLDGGHENCESEIHPVYALFMHTKDDPADDKWSFFIRNWGNEGWCSEEQEYLYRNKLMIVIPHENFDDVILSNHNIWANNLNPKMGVSAEKIKEGMLLTFTFDEPEEKGCFVGDLAFKWTGPKVTRRNDFKQNPKGAPLSPISASADKEKGGDKELMEKYNKLTPELKRELGSLLNGSKVSEKYPLYPKPSLSRITEMNTRKVNVDSIRKAIAIAKRKKTKTDYSKIVRSVPDSATAIRKQMRREVIKKFLKDN
jgi:hypothetical protein